MTFYLELASMMALTMTSALLNPFFWLVVVLVFVQCQRMNKFQQKLFGRAYYDPWRQTFLSIAFGFLGGTVGSVLLLLFGLSLNGLGVAYIWPVALVLLLFSPRFLCFAYAGGIVALASLLVRRVFSWWPGLSENFSFLAGLTEIHLPALIALIGILHLTEAFLIYISGHLAAAPIYTKSAQGEIVGGFNLQRFWPLPLIGLWAASFPAGSEFMAGGLPMPDWWPLLEPVFKPGPGEELVYLMVPLVAGLGYSDLALSSSPEEKKLKSVLNLAFYSIVLIALSLAADRWTSFLLPAVLMAPLGHEFLIQHSNRTEKSRTPLYRHRGQGVRVMVVRKGSPAQKAGIQAGDVITEVNGIKVNSRREVLGALLFSPEEVSFYIWRNRRSLNINISRSALNSKSRDPGIIFYPDQQTSLYLEVKEQTIEERFKNILARFKKG